MQYNLFQKFCFIVMLLIFSSTFIFGQDTINKVVLPDSIATQTITNPVAAPVAIDIDSVETGISIAPSTLRFNAKPGTIQTKTIKVTNDTRKNYNFQVTFQDYGLGADGTQDVGVKPEYRYALSKYLVVSPTLLELKGREAKTISVTLDIPPGDSNSIAMWTRIIVDQVTARPKLEIPDANANTLGMGISTGMGFGVNVYQNPPNVLVNNVDILSLKYEKASQTAGSSIIMKAKNTGDGIGYCLYYIELTNLLTGKQMKLKVKQFGIFPGYEKEFRYDLPLELDKGKYSVLAVIDFGNKEELHTAELDFTLE